jgi:hypothetical protein
MIVSSCCLERLAFRRIYRSLLGDKICEDGARAKTDEFVSAPLTTAASRKKHHPSVSEFCATSSFLEVGTFLDLTWSCLFHHMCRNSLRHEHLPQLYVETVWCLPRRCVSSFLIPAPDKLGPVRRSGSGSESSLRHIFFPSAARTVKKFRR